MPIPGNVSNSNFPVIRLRGAAAKKNALNELLWTRVDTASHSTAADGLRKFQLAATLLAETDASAMKVISLRPKYMFSSVSSRHPSTALITPQR